MKKKLALFILLSGLIVNFGIAQSYYFGLKGGPSVGYQKWETFNQSPLVSYHIATFIESYSEENPLNALFAQIGFHNRGSALRGAGGYTLNNEYFRLPTKNFVFSNLSLALGAKRKQELTNKLKSFYSFGLRGEYTLKTNLDLYTSANTSFSYYYYPDNNFVNKFTYGAQVGGGLEFIFSELAEGLFEITINPDLSNQYDQPQIGSVIDPYHPSNTITLDRRRIKNTTVEITFGLRFMRKVIYLD